MCNKPAKSQEVKVVDRGEMLEFERPSPFGSYKWKAKKSELTAKSETRGRKLEVRSPPLREKDRRNDLPLLHCRSFNVHPIRAFMRNSRQHSTPACRFASRLRPGRAPRPAAGAAADPTAGGSHPVQPAAPGQPGTTAAKPQVEMPKLEPSPTGGLTLQNASLREVIDILAQRLKINYILDPRVNGAVTINTYGETKNIDNRTLLDTILRINDAAMIQVGDIYRIVPLADVQRLPVVPGRQREAVPKTIGQC